MIEDSSLPPTPTTTPDDAPDAPRHVNSSDATMGRPIAERVMARKQELETLLAGLDQADTRTRGDIEIALSTVEELLTGDLTHIPPVVASDLSRWLEHNKHLAESAIAIDVVADSETVLDPVLASEQPSPGIVPPSSDDTDAS